MADDRSQEVVDAIRATLPEFCERNGLNARLTDEGMDNLSQWVAGVVPPGVARVGCGGPLTRAQREAEGSIACACTGHCQPWVDAEEWPRG